MSLTRSGYISRIIDKKITDYLQLFGAVLVEGPKWCGKTWTSLNHAESVSYIMDPTGNYSNRALAHLNPALILVGDTPRLIDEWQEVPAIWDAVRFDIDQNPAFGKYLLTGSTIPPRDSFIHSGTGRIASIRMRPMSLAESADSTCRISLQAVFEGERFDPHLCPMDIVRLIDLAARGGWPETLKLPLEKAGSIAIEYINSIIRNDLFHNDHSRRDQRKLRRLLRSLARNNATTAGVNTLVQDTGGPSLDEQNQADLMLSRNTVSEYLKSLMDVFVIEEIPVWNPAIRSKTIMRQASKRVFTDPSLAIAALGTNRTRLLNDLQTFGFMFENLCIRDLAIYAEAMGGSIFHYRDNSDLEVDVIIEMADGRWGAFEIKLGEERTDAAAQTLLRM